MYLFSSWLGYLEFYLAFFNTPGVVLVIPGFVSGERGEKMGGGRVRESLGARGPRRPYAFCWLGWNEVGVKKKRVG